MTGLAMFAAIYGVDETKAEQMIELLEVWRKATPEKKAEAKKLLAMWSAVHRADDLVLAGLQADLCQTYRHARPDVLRDRDESGDEVEVRLAAGCDIDDVQHAHDPLIVQLTREFPAVERMPGGKRRRRAGTSHDGCGIATRQKGSDGSVRLSP